MTVEAGSYLLPEFQPRPDWFDLAACRGMGPALFFPDRSDPGGQGGRGQPGPAEMTCMSCPVRTECLDWAIETGERHGWWGGRSPKGRVEVARRQRRGAA